MIQERPTTAAPPLSSPDEPVTVQVHTRTPRQRIDNFGASGCWMMDPIGTQWSDENKNRLADLLFSREKGIGLSLWRFNIGAGDPNPQGYWHPWRRVECFQSSPDAPFDGSKQAGQQWFLRAAKARGVEKTLAFVNSPPVWLTRNGRGFCDKEGRDSTNLQPGKEPEYARFLVRVLQYFEKQGLPFDYLSPFNEPNWDWSGGQEGCRYNNDDLKRVAKVIHAALHEAKLSTDLDLLDSGDLRALLDDDDYRAYQRVRKPGIHLGNGNEAQGRGKYRECVRELLGDPELRRMVGNRISSHSYWTHGSFHDLSALRSQLRRTLEHHAPGASYWQTEFCVMEHGRDLGMQTALRVTEVIHYDLAVAEASAWHWWLALSIGDYKDGLLYTDYTDKGGEQNILTSKTLWALGNYSRFIRPGARRVSVDTDAPPDALLASAYIRESEKQCIVVLVNRNDAPRKVRLTPDRSVRTFTPWLTSATHDLEALPSLHSKDNTFLVEVPAHAVVTLVGPLAETPVKLPVLPSHPQRERREVSDLYAVRCGANGPVSPTGGGRRNSRQDMPFGPDPGSGFHWGYSSYGSAGGRAEGDSTVRWEDGDTPGEGLTYRFELPPSLKRYTVEITIADPWNNPNRAMEIVLNGEVVKRDFVPGSGPVTLHYEATRPADGYLTLTARRAPQATAPDTDPLLSTIRVHS
jgi:O-glycosyl hydrolase